MRIGPARETDATALGRIVERAYGVYVGRIGRRPAPMEDDYAERIREAEVFVAEAAGAVVGLLVLVPAAGHLLIENVAVDPSRQGEGIGRALMSFAEAHAAEREIGELRLYTNVAMGENIAFYGRLGYREDGRRTERGLRRVFLSRRLEGQRSSSADPGEPG